MRTVRIHSFGDTSGLAVDQTAVPAPGPGEVRVLVAGATINRTDLNLRQNLYGLPDPDPEGYPVGMDLSGTIDALGAGVDGFAVGDPVVGFSGPPNGAQAQAESVVLPAEAVVRAPTAVSLPRAATLPLNGLTALQAVQAADLRSASTIVVTGAAGGLGMFLVQIARNAGHRVIAWIKSDSDADYVRRLGAGEVITDPAHFPPASADAVIDAATIVQPTIGLIKDHGIYVNFRSATPELERGIRTLDVMVENSQVQQQQLVDLVDAGIVELPAIEPWPLSRVAAAQDRFAAGGVRDRLVLIP